MFIRNLFLILLVFISSGCVRYLEKTSEVMSQNVYAVDSCRKTGRYDLLDGYVDNLTKLVPPPKNKIEIKNFNYK